MFEGQVEVLAKGVSTHKRVRWISVPKGEIQRFDSDMIDRAWSVQRFGRYPYTVSRLHEKMWSVSTEDYAQFRQLVVKSVDEVDFVDGLRRVDPNVRALVLEEFNIDVRNAAETRRQVDTNGSKLNGK